MKLCRLISQGCLILLIACTNGSGPQDPLSDLNPTEGTISGTITDPDGHAVAGAEVLLEPGGTEATTDGRGFFSIDVTILDRETDYVITISHDDFATITGTVTIRDADPVTRFDVELAWRDEDPPFETLDILHYFPRPFDDPLMDQTLDIRNLGSSTISNLVIVDTLDAEFEHVIEPGDILINEELFPTASVTMGTDGRTFQIELGDLAPTPDHIRAFTLRVPTPQEEGVFCNRVYASGELGEELLTDVEIVCLAT